MRRPAFNTGMIGLLLLCVSSVAMAADRFPVPDFTTGYTVPEVEGPAPPAAMWDVVDVVVLAAALVLAAMCALRWRSRKGIFAVMLACLAYFGFYRRGCVCAVGSIQNVVDALFDSSIALPWTVVAICLLPLLAAMLWGRVFCGGVCPLGAVQELVSWFPQRVPRPIAAAMSLLPWFALTVVLVVLAGQGRYLICRFDPFVGIFRGGGSWGAWRALAGILLVGVIIARPYCRFICPYGALLSVASWMSWKHLRISPQACITCRLCESSCPIDAIDEPTHATPRRAGRGRLAAVLLLGPVMIALGTWGGDRMADYVMTHHPLANLSAELHVAAGVADPESTLELTDESRAFLASGRQLATLDARIAVLRARCHWTAWIACSVLGLIVWLKLVGLTVRRARTEYTPHRAACVSCARCLSACPVQPNTHLEDRS